MVAALVVVTPILLASPNALASELILTSCSSVESLPDQYHVRVAVEQKEDNSLWARIYQSSQSARFAPVTIELPKVSSHSGTTRYEGRGLRLSISETPSVAAVYPPEYPGELDLGARQLKMICTLAPAI